MSIRLLLTLLVFGLGGAECQSSATPAWVKQTESVVSYVPAAEYSCAETTEKQDSDHDVLPAQGLRFPLRANSPAYLSATQVAFTPNVRPQARGPPLSHFENS